MSEKPASSSRAIRGDIEPRMNAGKRGSVSRRAEQLLGYGPRLTSHNSGGKLTQYRSDQQRLFTRAAAPCVTAFKLSYP